MLPSTSPREALLACPPSPPWNLPYCTAEFTLSSSCSLGQTALFLFLLARATLAYLPTALSALRPLFSFSAGPVCSSFSAEACAILHALCWSRQHQQVCHFSSLLLLSDSHSVLAVLTSLPSFLLPQSLWEIRQELFPLSFCSIRLQ